MSFHKIKEFNIDRFKFRVWKQNNLGYNIKNEFVKQKPHYEYFELNNNNIVFHKNDITEQCTGLKGKNGNLIYEEDIVTDGTDMFKVVWDYNAWCIQTNNFQHFLTDGFEVISNIYENPELLEDK